MMTIKPWARNPTTNNAAGSAAVSSLRIKSDIRLLQTRKIKRKMMNASTAKLDHLMKKLRSLSMDIPKCDQRCFLCVPVLPGNGFRDLLGNRIFVVGFMSWLIAQLLKVITEYIKTGKLDLRCALMAGGMPSSHSSVCVGVTTSIALQQGLGSALFALALCFTSIVMYDAAGIRRHAGYQAQILNRLMSDLPPDHPMSDRDMLKEVLGHTRREVLGGAVVGLLVGLFWPL